MYRTPQQQAEYEWDNNISGARAHRREIYVHARTAELDGTHVTRDAGSIDMTITPPPPDADLAAMSAFVEKVKLQTAEMKRRSEEARNTPVLIPAPAKPLVGDDAYLAEMNAACAEVHHERLGARR